MEPVVGKADGLEPRSLEILESFNLIDTVWPQTHLTMECCIWHPDEDGNIRRRCRKRNYSPELSRYQEATLEQAKIEVILMDNLKKFPCVDIVNGATTKSLDILSDDKRSTHPVIVEVERPVGDYGGPLQTSKVHASYLVGCDGAHSWTRGQMGARLDQYRTGDLWGVVDCLLDTNFPDLRNRCIITSKPGTMMVIPREEDMTRLYAPMSHLGIPRASITPDDILDAARNCLEPYELHSNHLRWWTTYEVSRGITSAYTYRDRIFLAGDAAHVHSPKAGQGMNISIQDGYNLGWKLASVISGQAEAFLLKTYESERRPIAERLMELDTQFYKLFPRKDDGKSDEAVQAVVDGLDQEHKGLAPITSNYFPTMAESIKRAGLPRLKEVSPFATGVQIGERLLDSGFVRHSDARPLSILTRLPSDGQWRVLVFGGNVSKAEERKNIEAAADQLGRLRSKHGSLLDIVLIHNASRDDMDLFSVPPVFLTPLTDTGYSYHKVYVDERSLNPTTGNTYEQYGIDESKGAMLLVRPDQVVAWTGALHQVDEMAKFIDAYLYRRLAHHDQDRRQFQQVAARL